MRVRAAWLSPTGASKRSPENDARGSSAVVRGSDLEEGDGQGLHVWSRHVGDPILESNITRRVDFALFMVAALMNDGLVHESAAIVGRKTPSALAHAGGAAAAAAHSNMKDL